MPFNLNNPLLAEDYINLKSRVKAECARRKYNGSVEEYSTSEYDYTVIPEEDGIPLPEHLNKIIIPLNAIKQTGISQTQEGSPTRDISNAVTILDELEAIEQDASNSGCSASCTGLCQGTCTGTCTNGCKTGCRGSCRGTCSGSCGYECSNDCTDVCADSCQDSCGFDCGSQCVDGCKSGCKSGCQGSCKGAININPD